MNYNLNDISEQQPKTSTMGALKKLLNLITEERRNMLGALLAIFINSGLNLLAPFIVGHVIDTYVVHKDFNGVMVWAGILLGMYLVAFVASYLQTRMMGGVGQRMLFKLRNTVFNKLQELPVGFFNQNKAGDLISRVNNDTDKINQFFSQSLMQFIGTITTMVGAGIFLLIINFKLGVATLLPGLLIFIFTKFSSPWIKKRNALSMQRTGGLSAEIQESLQNFKVIIAFNRRDYFKNRFEEANNKNYTSAIAAGIANNVFIPVYGFFAAVAQLVVLTFGIYLISTGQFSIGLLVSYLAYAVNFYNPLRQLAALWANFQVAMAGWDRISYILNLESDLPVLSSETIEKPSDAIMEFRNVSFGYDEGKEILHNINFKLEQGKTYALVGPTGGGKTTTASLIARLYDPVKGEVLLENRDIRTYEASERSKKIGFILQEPFLFSGTVRENILYSNEAYAGFSNEQLEATIKAAGLQSLLNIFEKGLDTEVNSGDSISIGQKQLIAFMRAVLRSPALLILDEATANIDTITEQILQDILNKLPATTTRVIIAHRLNTIQNADEIFFVNAGEVIRAGSFDHAVNMLLHGERQS
ncbi:ABC transporter ATP-binding protein [Ferruginibacter paludis]|uniref:ABC transporter ATP-binding protein n=1 Tax=Ferruginibacter paludis TaxID=1310417 RepID=UPI0025B5E04E|nr:ABC transporter ATP-binding protein [Ferruginibacter paludis]MDN3654967.1 ABC transporter ATP-binding protein [Ferruginibacter paludis]